MDVEENMIRFNFLKLYLSIDKNICVGMTHPVLNC